MDLGDRHDDVSFAADVVVIGVGDGEDKAMPGFDLLDLADHLVIDAITRGDDDGGHPLIDQGDGTMFHLAGGVAFGVDVANLFELKRSFTGNGIVDAAAQVEEVVIFMELFGQLAIETALPRLFQQGTGQPGQGGDGL